ncbi:unnamed protein product [Effrenium voratum]|nr:unnamed protein product [Effrenium voratum]CAJ1420777.1 unnamed protein product [Effrenium voratum]|mmetsp:Transcript_12673/g.30142  ORF Transcript_12673/g.30142 Transcript_12673/m.30142 type:complete len:358 (-) Transcript_12673:51-1124(-)
MDPARMPEGLKRFVQKDAILKELGEVVSFGHQDWKTREQFMRGHQKFEATCAQAPGPLCVPCWFFCCPCHTWLVHDAFSKNGDCATKALQEAVIAAATWYLLFPRHLVLVYWAPKTLEQDEESLEESQAEGNPSNETEGNPSNEAEENAPIETEEDQPYETNGDNAAYTRPEWNPNFKLKKNRVDKIYPLGELSEVLSEENVFARHQQGVTGGCQAWFTPKVPGVQIQGKGVEGDLVHQHTKHQQVTVSYGRAYVHGDIVGSMKTVTAETKRLEMPAPEQFVEVLKRQQTWAKKNPERPEKPQKNPKQQTMDSDAGSSSDKLRELAQLKQQGLITEEDFQQRKNQILDCIAAPPGVA